MYYLPMTYTYTLDVLILKFNNGILITVFGT